MEGMRERGKERIVVWGVGVSLLRKIGGRHRSHTSIQTEY
jgi:hypothetical protein